MPLALPDPPATLSGPARAFYAELLEMLAVVAPTRVDASKTSFGSTTAASKSS